MMCIVCIRHPMGLMLNEAFMNNYLLSIIFSDLDGLYYWKETEHSIDKVYVVRYNIYMGDL